MRLYFDLFKGRSYVSALALISAGVMITVYSTQIFAKEPKGLEPVVFEKTTAPPIQEAPSRFLDIQEVTSKGGITAWLVHDTSIPIIAMEFAFLNSGAKQDSKDKQGLARLLSNTMDEGAGKMDSQAFQKALRDYSITLRFSSGRDHFSGGLKTLSAYKDKAFNMLALALNEPRFDEDAIDRMRVSNISRVKNSISNPRWIAARLQNDIIYEGHPYALNSGGTITSLENITRADLKARHKALGRNSLVIGVSGDISAEDLKIQLDRIFGRLPEIEAPDVAKHDLTNAGEVYVFEKDIPQTVITIAQSGISRNDERYYSAKLMNFILGESGFGSRLMEEIREKRGLTYGIYSYFQDYDAADTLNVSTSTANENVDTMLDLIKAEWLRIQGEPVSDAELADAKSYIIGSLPLSLTSTASIASTVLSMQIDDLPIDYLDQRAEKFNAVSVEDVQNSAKVILNSDAFTTILVGKPTGFDNAQKITTLPNVE